MNPTALRNLAIVLAATIILTAGQPDECSPMFEGAGNVFDVPMGCEGGSIGWTNPEESVMFNIPANTRFCVGNMSTEGLLDGVFDITGGERMALEDPTMGEMDACIEADDSPRMMEYRIFSEGPPDFSSFEYSMMPF